MSGTEKSCPTTEIVYKKSNYRCLNCSVAVFTRWCAEIAAENSWRADSQEYQEEALTDWSDVGWITLDASGRRNRRLKWNSVNSAGLPRIRASAPISQLRCKTPKDPHEATVSNYWSSLLGSIIEPKWKLISAWQISSLIDRRNPFSTFPQLDGGDILGSPLETIPMLLDNWCFGCRSARSNVPA